MNPLLISSQMSLIPFIYFVSMKDRIVLSVTACIAFLYHREINCKSHKIILADRVSARVFTAYSIYKGFVLDGHVHKVLHSFNVLCVLLLHRKNKKHKSEGSNDGTLQKCKYHILLHVCAGLCWCNILLS